MNLYLVQHGDALPKDVDPERGLSEQGKEEVTLVAGLIEKGDVRVRRILHSGKKRAEQTALLLQSCLAPGGEFGETDVIAPLDPVDPVAKEAATWEEDTMLVGHLPFMVKLVSQLVAGNESTAVTAFRPGSVVCLEREETGNWVIAWMIRPELL